MLLNELERLAERQEAKEHARELGELRGEVLRLQGLEARLVALESPSSSTRLMAAQR